MGALPIEIRTHETQVAAFTQVGNAHVLLSGRPPLGDYLGFIKLYAIGGEALDNEGLTREWRSANDRVKELESREAGIADNVTWEALPETLQPLADAILTNPTVRKSYGNVPFTIGMVELDTLVVHQKHINLAYVEGLKEKLGGNPSEEAIFKLCFPLEEPLPPLQMRRLAPGNVFAFVSPSNDLRFLDATFLPISHISQYQTNGRITGVIALSVGFGTNCFNAVRADGRLLLNNASHRAFALRELGITRAPCLIQQVSRPEELPIVLNPELLNQTDRYFRDPRPPLLKDYFDEQLRKIIEVPKQNRQVRLAFVQEAADF